MHVTKNIIYNIYNSLSQKNEETFYMTRKDEEFKKPVIKQIETEFDSLSPALKLVGNILNKNLIDVRV